MDLRDLMKKRAALGAEAQALLSKTNPTKEDMAAAKAKLDEAEEVKAQIELLEKAMGIVDGKPHPAGDVEPPTGRGFKSLGDQMAAVLRASLPNGGIDSRLTPVDKEGRILNAASGLGEAIPADGGYLVEQTFVTELLKRTYETGVLVGRCRRLPIGANSNGIRINGIDETSRATGSRWGGIRVYRDAEADLMTGSKPKFRVIDMKLERMTGLCYATEELLEDSVLLEEVIMQGFPEEFGFKIDDEIVEGTGSGQMLGFLKAPCLVTVAKKTGQAADTVVAENIEEMWARVWSRSKPNAIWLINTSVGPQLMKMYHAVGTGGVPVYMPANGLSGQPYGTLFNRPVIEIEQASALGDVGDISCVDLSQYLYVDKGGIKAAQSIHVRFLYGENTFRFVLRNNGEPIWHSALTPFKGSDDVSPFVTLAAR